MLSVASGRDNRKRNPKSQMTSDKIHHSDLVYASYCYIVLWICHAYSVCGLKWRVLFRSRN